MTQQFVRPPIAAGAIPSPNPTSSALATTAIAQHVAVANPVALPGSSAAPGLVGYTTTETDTQSAPSVATTSTTTDYYAFAPVGSTTTVRLVESLETTEAGASFSLIPGAGNGLVDVLPETTGTLSPPNGPAQTTVETDPYGQRTTRTTAASGTYVETTTYPIGGSSTAQIAANGSGTYAFPLDDAGPTTFSVGAPSGGTIPISIAYAPGLSQASPGPAATPTVVTLTAPVWYAVPLVLSSDVTTDGGPTTLSSGCTVPSPYASPVRILTRRVATVDPLFGENDARTTTTFTQPGVGVVCTQLVDVVTQYYDFSGSNPGALAITAGAPIQTTTTTETLSLQSATVVGLDATARAAGAAAVRAGTARFDAVLATARAARRAALRTALAARAPLPGGTTR